MFYQIELPDVSAFFDFARIFPAFVKEAAGAVRQPGLGQSSGRSPSGANARAVTISGLRTRL